MCFVAIFATSVGAISGMGGGVIIKPIMDAVSGLDIAVINFMSGCTVLAMALVSVYRGRKDHLDIDLKLSTVLALGACLGGVLGKLLFEYFPGNLDFIQSAVLFVLNLLIYVYLKFKTRIQSLQLKNLGGTALVGGFLGALSAFLGIGGGPFNVVILHYFYSSEPKITAKRSIFVILLSQISSLLTVLVGGVPEGVPYLALALMCVGGCTGAILGAKVVKKFNDTQMDEFFKDVLVGIIVLNAYNLGRIVG